MNIPADDPRAVAVVTAIQNGNVEAVEGLLREHAGLATARIVDKGGTPRSLLHIACDWPGHFPNAGRTIGCLIRAGAELNPGIRHPTNAEANEKPLHWAASSDDVEAIDALLDGGADIEAPGAIFTGGAPMSDAVVFGQWKAARRLLERGAKTEYWQDCALGLLDRVKNYFEGSAASALPTGGRSGAEITNGLWNACHGGHLETAQYMVSLGANLNWVGYDRKTPLAAARKSGNDQLVDWLRARGAKTADELSS